MHKKRLFIVSLMLIFMVGIIGCATLTALQKHTVTMGTHNRIMGDYLRLYDQQPPEIQAKWKVNIDPIAMQLDDAMTVWDNSFMNQDDPEAKRQLYMAIKSQLFSLFFKYGVEIEEE